MKTIWRLEFKAQLQHLGHVECVKTSSNRPNFDSEKKFQLFISDINIHEYQSNHSAFILFFGQGNEIVIFEIFKFFTVIMSRLGQHDIHRIIFLLEQKDWFFMSHGVSNFTSSSAVNIRTLKIYQCQNTLAIIDLEIVPTINFRRPLWTSKRLFYKSILSHGRKI